MTGALAGHGRADPVEGWGATVFIQVLDPQSFAGLPAFQRQMDHVVEAAHTSRPRPGGEGVRLPGERGLQRRRDATAHGVALYPAILPALEPWARKYDVAQPQPLR